MRIDANGITHPTESDPFEPEGVYHIGNCEECRAQFPTAARMDDQIRYGNPAEYAKMRERVETH